MSAPQPAGIRLAPDQAEWIMQSAPDMVEAILEAQLYAHKPAPRFTYRAWVIGQSSGVSTPVELPPVASVPEAAQHVPMQHKDSFYIAEHDALADRTALHFYRVRKGKAQWRKVPGDVTLQRVEPLSAEFLHRIMVPGHFEPVQPFDAIHGDRVFGNDTFLRRVI